MEFSFEQFLRAPLDLLFFEITLTYSYRYRIGALAIIVGCCWMRQKRNSNDPSSGTLNKKVSSNQL